MVSNKYRMQRNLDKMPLKSYMKNQKVVIHKTYFLIRFSAHAIWSLNIIFKSCGVNLLLFEKGD